MPPETALDAATALALKRFLERAAQRWDVAGAVLFGSRARATHRPDSDIDLAVLLRGPHDRLLPTKLAMADEAFDVLLETGQRVQPLPIWLDEWEHPERSWNPELIQTIAREGVPV